MRNVYTVRQVNAYIKNMFTQDFMLNRIYVKGEVSNCRYHTSGHIYFSLKDESGTIACVMFAGSRAGLSFRMQEGQTVIVLGSVSVYERDGKYQLYAKEIVLDGAGMLYERFEALKRELEEMGMFAPEYKQPIPAYVQRVGIVTAPTGAAVRDIMNIAARRNPYVQLILYPALVQGEGAVPSIVRGIRMLDAYGVDVIIVGRGGGSIEDLWAFNEENTAQAIYECSTPVISAVGHETDTTIADYVADLRAPTPSAAAELAVYDVRLVQETLFGCKDRLIRAMFDRIDDARQELAFRERQLKVLNPSQQVLQKRQYVADMEDKLTGLMNRLLEDKKYRLQLLAGRLDGMSPLKRLESGFAYFSDQEGNRIESVKKLAPGDQVDITLADGRVRAEVKELFETAEWRE